MAQAFHPNQITAITHKQGPMLVLAGPGSGKTTVIVHRIRYLTEELQVPPHRILVITFTKAAAEQMKTRFAALSMRTGIVFGTFHSAFFRILRRARGYHVDQVLKEEQKQRALRGIFTQMQVDSADAEEYIQQFLQQLSLMKNELLTLEQFQPEGTPREEFRQMAQAYAAYKKQEGKIDFDDMLTECWEVLQQEQQQRIYWQSRYEYILVDEFQDVNRAQYDCLRLLAAPKNNLFVVGDDDQSIYGFRGARPDFMLRFPKDYPKTKQVILNVNYRSSERIIRLAEQVIGRNTCRYEKHMRGNRDLGDKINVFTAEDGAEEAEVVANKILRLGAQGIPWEEMAVIYRTNVQGGAFARALYRKGIPYWLRDGGTNLYEHWIAKDLQAYLFLAENPDSDQALLQILNKPKRYISKELLMEAEQMPYGLRRSLQVCPSLKRWQQEPLERLEEDLAQIRRRAPHEALRYIRNVVGYDEYLMEYAAYRKANLSHWMEIADELTETAKDTADFAQYGKRLEEMSTQMQKQSSKTDRGEHTVTLTTMHSAKGLEFTAVFLPSLAEGILPYEKSKAGAHLEEERRLFYVGLTRTKDRLFLSFARNRYDKPVKPSRFLLEMGLTEQLLLKENRKKL